MDKCSIIEDMIPLYKEGLCSEDTAAMVEEHIKTCDNCRRLYEDITVTKDSDVKTPEESKVFRKVSRKMKRSRIRIILLTALLIIILGGLGVLTAGQITRADGMISFETIIQSIETYRIAKLIAKGDMDAYADSISYGATFDPNLNIWHNTDIIRAANKKALNDAYDMYLSDKKVKGVYSFAKYMSFTGSNDDTTVYSNACIAYKDGTNLILEFVKSYDGKYICVSSYSDQNDNTADWLDNGMCKVINYTNIPKFYPDGLDSVLFCRYDKERIERGEGGNPDLQLMMTYWFVYEQRKSVNSAMKSYYRKGFTIDKFISSEIRYDEDKSMIFYDIFMEGKDEQGTAMMTTRIYSTPYGLLPPAEEDIEVIPNGCTDELTEAICHFFG